MPPHTRWLVYLAVLVGPLTSTNSRTGAIRLTRHDRHQPSTLDTDKKARHKKMLDDSLFPQYMYSDQAFSNSYRSGKVQGSSSNTNNDEKTVRSPITFRSPAAYMITELNTYDRFTIYFELKTTQPDGLVFYSGSDNSKDFLALELVNGRLKYVFDVGSGPRTMTDDIGKSLNDNKWHMVSLVRPEVTQHILQVDDSATYDKLPDSTSKNFDTNNNFYIGGINKEMFNALPDKIHSREGFQGCLGSFNLNGDNRNLLDKHLDRIVVIPEEYKENITLGCEGPKTECSESSCSNGGHCIQEWTSFTCNCDMTSFTGPTCDVDGTAYIFGSGGGLIHYSYTENEAKLLNPKRDELALGFITGQKDAILVRINSKNSEDYVEMELVDGKIYVVYNMGTMDHPIGQLFDRVDDGMYHVVKFIRNGANASVQIDDTDPQVKNPIGNQLSVFNNVGDIYIGGRKDEEGHLVKPFVGTIAGLVTNGLAVLEKTAEGDSHITIEGDVQLQIQPIPRETSVTAEPATSPVIVTPETINASTPGMQSTMGVQTIPKGNGATDDIVFVGDREDCEETEATDCPDSDPDVFISTKVTFKSTQQSPTTLSPSPSVQGELEPPCEGDDDDCITGSGSGANGLVDPVNTPKTDDIEQIVIDAGTTHATNTTTADSPKIFVDVDMTEKPSKTSHRPIKPPGGPSVTTPSSKGGGPGSAGGASSGGGAQDRELKRGNTALGMNIGLIVGIAVGVVLLLLIVAFAVYKYKSRDEGSYKIDESKNYSYETCNTKPPPQVNGGVAKTGSNCSKSKKKDVKEWYV